ncbi:MAG: master DNA invertase Mpi family serine-type recombinase [Bacteroidales bacterium]|jgi:DNA invertase Pin-like site-specific DNA recombinase|nr:master DNA invertase Mpi family serine-type recombinase [Bacteroidales bacterium]
MIYGYIRVSTDKQTVENQRFEIENFCTKKNIVVQQWIEETISGTKEPEKRALGKLLKRLNKGDILICSELSRLGRTLFMIMDILSACMKKEIQLWTIKDGYRLGSDISSKVLAFAFGLSAEIERNLISQRTKEALARAKAEGKILGRPKGKKSQKVKLSGCEEIIQKMIQQNIHRKEIAKVLKVDRNTLHKFICEKALLAS